jgi:hypothetical protein
MCGPFAAFCNSRNTGLHFLIIARFKTFNHNALSRSTSQNPNETVSSLQLHLLNNRIDLFF